MQFRWTSFVVLATFLGLTSTSFGQFFGICPKGYPEGFLNETLRGKEVLQKGTTSDPKNVKIFVMKQGEHVFAHSNLQPKGADNPIKVTLESLKGEDLRLVTLNVLHFGLAGKRDLTAADQLRYFEHHENDITFILDQNVFDSNGRPTIDLGGASRIEIAFSKSTLPKKARPLKQPRGPPVWIAEWDNNVFVKVNRNLEPGTFFSNLTTCSFTKDSFRLVSLFVDKAVEEAISASPLKRAEIRLPVVSRDALEQAFASNKGNILALLGHVENGSFVTRSSDGATELLRIPLTEVQAFSERYHVDVVYLGCNSANAAPVGANREFNPLFAIRQLESAIESTNLYQFISELSSPSLGIVLDNVAFTNKLGAARRPKSVEFRGIEKARGTGFDQSGLSRIVEVGLIGLLLSGGGGFGGDSGGADAGSAGSNSDDRDGSASASSTDGGSGSSNAASAGSEVGSSDVRGATTSGSHSVTGQDSASKKDDGNGRSSSDEPNGLSRYKWILAIIGLVVVFVLYKVISRHA